MGFFYFNYKLSKSKHEMKLWNHNIGNNDITYLAEFSITKVLPMWNENVSLGCHLLSTIINETTKPCAFEFSDGKNVLKKPHMQIVFPGENNA